MANNLDRIVTVNIDIAAPAIDAANFDNLLIFGPAPSIPPPRPLPYVAVYSSLAEVTGAGYTAIGAAADPVGVAARIAFSQTPRPTEIFIAAMQAAPPSIENAQITIITEGADDKEVEVPSLQIKYARHAVSGMEIEVEKDGVLIFGKSLPLTKNKNALFQVPLGKSVDIQGDQLGLPTEYWAGAYTVTLTATQGIRTTTLVGTVTFDGAAGVTVGSVTQTVTPEMLSPGETLEIANERTGWYVACAAGIPESEYENCAKWTEAHTKLFAYTFLSDTDPVPNIYYRSHGWCGLENDMQYPEDAPMSQQHIGTAATARCLSFPAGSETWAFKRLAAVLPSQFSTTFERELAEGDSNYFEDRGIVSPDEYDTLGNLMPGFVVSVPLSATITPTQRASRVLVDCKFTARLAGAIHAVRVDGTLTYEFFIA